MLHNLLLVDEAIKGVQLCALHTVSSQLWAQQGLGEKLCPQHEKQQTANHLAKVILLLSAFSKHPDLGIFMWFKPRASNRKQETNKEQLSQLSAKGNKRARHSR